MKENVAKKWIVDLRRNYKKKTTQRLKDPDKEKYCCLGRLCLILGHDFDDEGYVLSKNGKRYKASDGNWEKSLLPKPIRKEAGLKSISGYIKSMDEELTSMNDGGAGFKRIATTIEKHWQEL